MQWSKEQSLRSVTDRKECCFISFIPFHFWKRRESMNVFTRLNWICLSSHSLNSEGRLLCLDWHFALNANTMNEPTLPIVAIKINKFMWLSSIILGSWLSSVQFNSFHFSLSVVSDSLRPHELQHARPPCPSPTPRVHPNPCPLCRWYHPTIYPLSPPSSPTFNLSQHQGLLKWASSLHQVAKVLEFQLQH